MKYLIQKFGGTSVATKELREQVAAKVIKAKAEGYNPIVVVSAIGRQGDPYATDTLINLVTEFFPDPPVREMDLLMSCGEIISGVLMVNTLKKMGHEAVLLTGAQAGIITDNTFSNARILQVEPSRIHQFAREHKIVVVTGFQGTSENGEITTLGRGGSDTSAAVLGVALDAEAVDIYTDVEGIMTADPRIVSDARVLDVITYNEICNMAHEGAKVIHPRAVEIAMQKNIPLRVKCTFSDAPGTLVTAHGVIYEGKIGIEDRPVTGITHIPNVTQLKVFTKDYPEIKDASLKIFKALALSGISVDFINVHPHAVIFTVKDAEAGKAVEILENMGFKAEVTPGCAKVSAVGAGMAGIPGVMAHIVEALTRHDIKILQSADSHTTIWCLVKKEDMEKAIQALHEQFKLNT